MPNKSSISNQETMVEASETEVSRQITEYTVEELLISCVEARPPLWDSRLPLKERSKIIRDKLWMEIFEEFGKNPEFSIEFLQKKWRNLRDTFVRIKGEYTPLVDQSQSNKKRKWEYFDMLLLLNDSISYRPTVSNIAPLPTPSPSGSCSSTSPLLSPINVEKKSESRPKKDNIEGTILNALQNVNSAPLPTVPTAALPNLEDNVNPICIRISDMLKMMPQKARVELEIKLLQTAYEGSQNYLN